MNSITIAGQLVQQPELRYTESDQTPIATSYLEFLQYAQGGEQVPAKVALKGWGKYASAELMKASQGHRVVISGSLRMNTFERPDGLKEKKAEIWVQNLVIVESPVTHPTN